MPEPILVGGKCLSGSGPILDAQNPANGHNSGSYTSASSSDLDQAVHSAKKVIHSSWRETLPHNRAKILSNVAELVERDSESLACLQMKQNGKTIKECRKQVESCASIFRYFSAVCETQEGVVTTPRGNAFSMSISEPYGVVGLITPWNSPLTMDAQKLAPALAGGNAVLLKPSEITPGIGLALGKLCIEAGFPEGLISVLTGRGDSIGSAIVKHPDVRMVSFTGGTETGKAIAVNAAKKLMPVALELGGKSPHIVFSDSNQEEAVISVANGIFGSMGQSCVAGSRLFVERKVYASFLKNLVDIAKSYLIGSPLDENTDLGPLASFKHRKIVESYVDIAISEGGNILTGGVRPVGLDEGAYFLPTVIDKLNPAARVCREEIFGPVLVAIPFDTEEELVQMANNSPYGLACGIWTNDTKKAWRLARRIDAGTVWINSYKSLSIANPFGGMKESGLGREKGRQGIGLYQNQKTISFAI